MGLFFPAFSMNEAELLLGDHIHFKGRGSSSVVRAPALYAESPRFNPQIQLPRAEVRSLPRRAAANQGLQHRASWASGLLGLKRRISAGASLPFPTATPTAREGGAREDRLPLRMGAPHPPPPWRCQRPRRGQRPTPSPPNISPPAAP